MLIFLISLYLSTHKFLILIYIFTFNHTELENINNVKRMSSALSGSIYFEQQIDKLELI